VEITCPHKVPIKFTQKYMNSDTVVLMPSRTVTYLGSHECLS